MRSVFFSAIERARFTIFIIGIDAFDILLVPFLKASFESNHNSIRAYFRLRDDRGEINGCCFRYRLKLLDLP